MSLTVSCLCLLDLGTFCGRKISLCLLTYFASWFLLSDTFTHAHTHTHMCVHTHMHTPHRDAFSLFLLGVLSSVPLWNALIKIYTERLTSRNE